MRCNGERLFKFFNPRKMEDDNDDNDKFNKKN